MYRVWELSEKEKGKIVRLREGIDCCYYDVFETQEECDKEQKRLDKIEELYKKAKEAYRQSLKKGNR